MKMLIVHVTDVSLIDLTNLREFNREHHPIAVVVIDNHANSARYKVKAEIVEPIVEKLLAKKSQIIQIND